VNKALESGAEEREITEAIEAGKMVRKGAASKMDMFASNLGQAVPSTATASDEGCGCGS
jgi:hypothetical protein